MSSLFAETSSIKEAVALIKNVSTNKLPLILTRIAEKLHQPGEAVFTDGEINKLASSLKISEDGVRLVLTSCQFFLSQAAYHNAKAAAFGKQLVAVGLDEERSAIFQQTWAEHGKSVISLLRKKSIATLQLDSINWQLKLEIAQKSKAKQKTPRALFELEIKDPHTQKSDGMQIEFDHQELYQFFNQLDTIQSQLDGLS